MCCRASQNSCPIAWYFFRIRPQCTKTLPEHNLALLWFNAGQQKIGCFFLATKILLHWTSLIKNIHKQQVFRFYFKSFLDASHWLFHRTKSSESKLKKWCSQPPLAYKSRSWSWACSESKYKATATVCCIHLFPAASLMCSQAKIINQPQLPGEPSFAYGRVQGLARCTHNRLRGAGERIWMDPTSQQHTCQSRNTATLPATPTGSPGWSRQEEAIATCRLINNANEVPEASLLSFSLLAVTYWQR